MRKLNKSYWEKKYNLADMAWDIGYIATPLRDYIDQLQDKQLKILVPGAGNGYEVEYLVQQGFTHVFVIDIARQPLERIQERLPNFPKHHLIEADFFDFQQTDFDLVLEQTFFCALDPSLRRSYAFKMSQLLKEKGKLVGLLFDFPLTDTGPPFGGSASEYRTLFKDYFSIKILERAYNSIKPRAGTELFFIFEK
ncbi:MAG: methyltransferase domain-containing protein [Saonia sp.]